MNKTELITAMAEASGLTKKDCDTALNAFVDTLQTALKSGDKVQLLGFGTFEVKERAARTGKNPATGATIEIPASKAPAFKPGKAFKDSVHETPHAMARPPVGLFCYRCDTPMSLARQAHSSTSVISVRSQGASAWVKCP